MSDSATVEGTAKELGEKWGVDATAANGLIKYLEAKGQAKPTGKKLRAYTYSVPAILKIDLTITPNPVAEPAVGPPSGMPTGVPVAVCPKPFDVEAAKEYIANVDVTPPGTTPTTSNPGPHPTDPNLTADGYTYESSDKPPATEAA